MSGIFLFTLDTEIAWGTFYRKGWLHYRKHFEEYRDIVKTLVGLLERYEIKATWAFVGHLFLEQCDGVHADVLRPRYPWFENGADWHRYDPGTDLKQDPWWYGRDVLNMVRSMRPHQEIATHTFSHVILDDPAVTFEIARSQLESHIKLAQSMGIEISSLVFPKNRVAYLDAASSLGIRAFRGPEQSWQQVRNRNLRHFLTALNLLMPAKPPVYSISELETPSGVLNIPASMFLLPYDGIRRIIPSALRIRRAQRGITAAVRNKAIFHLWCHPFNFGSSPKMFYVLEKILERARAECDKGLLENMTMQEIAFGYGQK